MPIKNPRQRENELVAAKKKELLGFGYKPGIVETALDWAVGNAEGIARRAHQDVDEDPTADELGKMTVQFLPFYLDRIETYMRSFGHERGEFTPKA